MVDTVKAYINHEDSREAVEKAIKQVETSTSEKELDPSAVSRGSSFERDENGLFTLAGGKITDYRKMAEGALTGIIQRRVWQILQAYQFKNLSCFRR